MPNPFNPLNWVTTSQDWFAKAERSSGFRPYLIYLFIVSGLSVTLLTAFPNLPQIVTLAVWILGGSFLAFVILFSLKAFQDPEFCRSERHLQTMKKLELEHMGSESEILPGEVVEEQTAIEEPLLIGDNVDARAGDR